MSLRVGQTAGKGGGAGGGGVVLYKNVWGNPFSASLLTPDELKDLEEYYNKDQIAVVRNAYDGKYWQYASRRPGQWTFREFTAVVAGPKGDTGATGAKGDKGDTGAEGPPGDGIDLSAIGDNEIPYKPSGGGANRMVGSGITVTQDSIVTRKILNVKELITDSSTITVGSIEIKENGTFLTNHPGTDPHQEYIFLDFSNPENGPSKQPLWFPRKAPESKVERLQNPATYTEQIANVQQINFGHPQDDNEVSAIWFKFTAAVANLKGQFVINGYPVGWFPSKHAWDTPSEPGLNLNVGEQKITLATHVTFLTEHTVTLELRADGLIPMLGKNNFPWYAIDRKNIPKRLRLLDETDLGSTGGGTANDSDTDTVYVDFQSKRVGGSGTLLDPYDNLTDALAHADTNMSDMIYCVGTADVIKDLTIPRNLVIVAPGATIKGALIAGSQAATVKLICQTMRGMNSHAHIIEVFEFFKYVAPPVEHQIYYGFAVDPSPIGDPTTLTGTRQVSALAGSYHFTRSVSSPAYMHIVYPKSLGEHIDVRIANSLWSKWSVKEVTVHGEAYYDLASPFETHSTDVILEVK